MSLVFLDIVIGKSQAKQIVFELYINDLPKTCENFRALCTGEKTILMSNNKVQKKLHYKGTKFHKMVRDFMAQGGDITHGDGRGGWTIYGETIKDESFKYVPNSRGLLILHKIGPNQNNSQFYISYVPCLWLKGKNIVFGKAINGIEVIQDMEAVSSDNGVPKAQVVIQNCGIYVPPPVKEIKQIQQQQILNEIENQNMNEELQAEEDTQENDQQMEEPVE